MGAAGAAMLPGIPLMGNPIAPERALEPVDVAQKKQMADVALNAARSRGATYTDVRIGRYLNQFIITREDKVENIVNTESYGMGVRVIANGSWGFAATDKLDKDSIARTAELAVSIAKENARLLIEPGPFRVHGHLISSDDIRRHPASRAVGRFIVRTCPHCL